MHLASGPRGYLELYPLRGIKNTAQTSRFMSSWKYCQKLFFLKFRVTGKKDNKKEEVFQLQPINWLEMDHIENDLGACRTPEVESRFSTQWKLFFSQFLQDRNSSLKNERKKNGNYPKAQHLLVLIKKRHSTIPAQIISKQVGGSNINFL